ncbi:MAG: hypothetical protein Salg2KO_14650 [Salibacteraceae bacterium]
MNIIDQIRNASRLARQEFYNFRSDLFRDDGFLDLNPESLRAVRDIQKHGYAVLPSFFDSNKCQLWIDEIDRLIASEGIVVTEDAHKSDLRIYAADRVSNAIQDYFLDAHLRGIVEGYERHSVTDGFTLGARLESVKNNLGSGGGWHRDSASIRQTKAIVYLSDVETGNGPFQYLEGSHKPMAIIKDQLKNMRNFNQNRFSNEEVEQLIATDTHALKTITGKAGTVILSDTRGIHRGKPIEQGTRYALTNYLWFSTKMPDHVKRAGLANSGVNR